MFDEGESNAVLIASEPLLDTRPLEYYPKTTKNTLGLSRNGGGVSPEDGVQGGSGAGSGRASGESDGGMHVCSYEDAERSFGAFQEQ